MLYNSHPDELEATRKKIGIRFREKRLKNKLTLHQTAMMTGLSWYTIESIELGKRNYSIDSLLILSKAMKELFRKKLQEGG